MIGLGKILYKTTGIMTKSQIKRTCLAVGKDLSEISKNKQLQTRDFVESLDKYIGPRTKRKFKVSGSNDEIIEHITSHLGICKEDAKIIVNDRIIAASIPQGTGKQGLLALKLEEFSSVPNQIEFSVHELEHLLYQQTSLQSLKAKIALKFINPKKTEKTIRELANLSESNSVLQDCLLNTIGVTNRETNRLTNIKDLKQALLEYSKNKSVSELEDQIWRNILTILGKSSTTQKYDTKTRLKIIEILKEALKDEARAYQVGAEAMKNHLGSDNVALPELVADVYKRANVILTMEKIEDKIHRFVELFKHSN